VSAAQRGSAAYAVSPSQIKDFDFCERSWYLASVARAQEDGNAGGLFLAQGDLFDEAVQRHAAKMDLHSEDLVGAVRADPRRARPGVPEDKWPELGARAARMLRAVQSSLPAPKTASVQKRYRVFVPGYEDRGGVVITGKTDLHQRGYIVDTKSTSDRGPGRGAAADRAPNALTDATTPGGDVKPLRDDVQARVYAWCEFQTDPDLAEVRCRWVYASKPSGEGNPVGWHVEALFERAETEAWFAAYVRPRLDRMVELHEASLFELVPFEARANTDSCLRCFRRLSCQNPFAGAQAPLPQGAVSLMPTAAEIRARQAARAAGGTAPAPAAPPAPSLEEQLRASLSPAVTGLGLAPQGLGAGGVPNVVDFATVNRPAPAEPTPAVQAVVTTTGVDVTEAPAVALREALAADVEAVAADPADFPGQAGSERAESAPAAPVTEPRRGRGRPRKPRPPTPAEETASGSYDPAAAAEAKTRIERVESLEKIATALQAVADAADSAVQTVNAELRALGVRL
jgi:hypothetical protein